MNTWKPIPLGGFAPGDVFYSTPDRTVVLRGGVVVWDVGTGDLHKDARKLLDDPEKV